MAIRRERFRAVDDPAAIFSCGDGSRPSRVGPGFGLGQRPAAEFFALRERNHVLLSLLFIAKFVDVIRAERVVGRDDEPDGAVDPSQLFDHRHVLDVAEARAAVFFWKNDSEQSHLAELRDQFGRKTRGFIPLHHVGSDFGFGKFADAAPEVLLFVGEGEIHGASGKLQCFLADELFIPQG